MSLIDRLVATVVAGILAALAAGVGIEVGGRLIVRAETVTADIEARHQAVAVLACEADPDCEAP